MKKLFFLAIVAFLMMACMGNHASSQREPQSGDTLYTAEAAMDIYDQDPNRALVIIDSALLVGNIDEDLATMLKAKIYCHSNMEQHLQGRELKALEAPGLWNGAMSDWNTLFVEVPLETFNPVKTVLDLLRPAHQA